MDPKTTDTQTAGQASALALAPCSGWVPVGQLLSLAADWEEMAAERRDDSKWFGAIPRAERMAFANGIGRAASELRLLAALATERQPTSNVQSEPRGSRLSNT